MKTILIALLSLYGFANAIADTNIIAMSEWSQPISLRNENLHDQFIRGRLLIIKGMAPAYGGPPITNGSMTFIELQNTTKSCCDDIDVYFDVMKLDCHLTDTTGQESLKLSGGIWSGPGSQPPRWINLPYNSRIRLFVNGGNMEKLAVYPTGVPSDYWVISESDTNTYFLSGTMGLSTHSNLNLMSPSITEKDYKENRTATLEFPRFRVTPKEWAEQGVAGYPPQGVGSPER
jgi:hypothetical protein